MSSVSGFNSNRENNAYYFVGAHLDVCGTLKQGAVAGASNPGSFKTSVGGICFNMAAASAQLGLQSTIISPLGNDINANIVRSALNNFGIRDGTFEVCGAATANYTSIVQPDGNLVIALADMEIYENTTFEEVSFIQDQPFAQNDYLVLNTNLKPEVLKQVFDYFRGNDVQKPKIAAATVSYAKAPRLRPFMDQIDLLFTNRAEAARLLDIPDANIKMEEITERLHKLGCTTGAITNGAQPLYWWNDANFGEIAPPKQTHPVNVIGAGDALSGTVLAALNDGKKFVDAVQFGVAAAALTISTTEPVYKDLSWGRLASVQAG